MKWPFRALLAALLCFAGLWEGGIASTRDTQHRAGLVVDYGDGTVTYAVVPFDEPGISGIELLKRSGVSLVTVEFGGLGEAVCTIGERGCGAGACRRRVCQGADPDSPFWQYFRLSDGETWTPLVLGASSSTVEDGSIEGWSWTGAGPGLPIVDLNEIEALLEIEPSVEGLSNASSRTFDASGQVIESESRRSSMLSYAGAVMVIVVLVGVAGLLVVRRTRRPGARE